MNKKKYERIKDTPTTLEQTEYDNEKVPTPISMIVVAFAVCDRLFIHSIL